jgi:16S rRNA A1518/A1519 N6-dimethyltransferase RsmA/KsgA/DIM1 with predicted DNA glycosylase/AP lyase activity
MSIRDFLIQLADLIPQAFQILGNLPYCIGFQLTQKLVVTKCGISLNARTPNQDFSVVAIIIQTHKPCN